MVYALNNCIELETLISFLKRNNQQIAILELNFKLEGFTIEIHNLT
jgi:hypothetical protein